MNGCKVTNSKGQRCDREVTFHIAAGVCGGHHSRMVRWGTYAADRPLRPYTKSEANYQFRAPTPGATPEERFWNRVRKEAGCWFWDGTMLNSGYGQLDDHGLTKTAHRFAWELHFGQIPKGARIRQTCHNKRCVKPSHLEMVGGLREEVAA